MQLATKVHLHEIVAALIAVVLALTVAALALLERDTPEVVANAFFAAMAYVFGTRASTTLQKINGTRNDATSPPGGAP